MPGHLIVLQWNRMMYREECCHLMFTVYVLRQIQVHAKCQIIFTCSDPAPALPSFEISEH